MYLVAKSTHGFLHDHSLVEWIQGALHLHSAQNGEVMDISTWLARLEHEAIASDSSESKQSDESNLSAQRRLQLARTLARDDVHSVTVHAFGSHFRDGPWSLPSDVTVLSLQPVYTTLTNQSFEPFIVDVESPAAPVDDLEHLSAENLFASSRFDCFRTANAPRSAQSLRIQNLDEVAAAGQLVMDLSLQVNEQYRQQHGVELQYEYGRFKSVV
jgi:hypothetical protein